MLCSSSYKPCASPVPIAAHHSLLDLLLAQVSLCVAVAGTPITLDSCATPVPSPDCKVQPWAGAPRPVNDSERLQAVAEVAGGIQGQSPAFLPDRYIELCRRIFDVSLHDAPHVCLSAPGRPSHLHPGVPAEHMRHAAAAVVRPCPRLTLSCWPRMPEAPSWCPCQAALHLQVCFRPSCCLPQP